MKKFVLAVVLIVSIMVGNVLAFEYHKPVEKDYSKQVLVTMTSCDHGRRLTYVFSGANCIGDPDKSTSVTYISYRTRNCSCIPEVSMEFTTLEEMEVKKEDLEHLFDPKEKEVENVYDESTSKTIEKCVIIRYRQHGGIL